MLSNPRHGWTDITIGSFTGCGSCIQDVPVLLMEVLARVLAYGMTSPVEIDEEGSVFTIIFAPEAATLVRGDERTSLPLPARQLAYELLADLRRDWDSWLAWPAECRSALSSPRELRNFREGRAAHLARLMHTLENLL